MGLGVESFGHPTKKTKFRFSLKKIGKISCERRKNVIIKLQCNNSSYGKNKTKHILIFVNVLCFAAVAYRA